MSNSKNEVVSKEEPSWTDVYKRMSHMLSAHPWWKKRCEGTPLENDLIVRATFESIEIIKEYKDKVLFNCKRIDSVQKYRSVSEDVSKDYDSVRVVMDMDINEWKKMKNHLKES